MKKVFALVTSAALAALVVRPLSGQGLIGNQNGRGTLAPRGLARPGIGGGTLGGGAEGGTRQASAPGANSVDAGGRSIEFNGASLEVVFMVYGNLVDKTVLKDPAVPAASITLQPKKGQDLSDEDKILAIETVLEMNGVHLEPYGDKFVRALPRQTANADVVALYMDPDAELGDTTRVVSMMLTFRNIALDEAQKALEGLKSAKGTLNVFERTSSILVTDTEMNIKRMREIAKKMDVPTPVTENVFVRQVKNASAEDIKTALEAIVQESQKALEKEGKAANTVQRPQLNSPFMNRPGFNRPGQPQQPQNQPQPVSSLVTSVSDADRGMIRGKVLILADERSNKLIIVTNKTNMDFFDKVIEQLDVETTPDIAVKIYRLKYADAEDVSDMINDLIGNAASSKNSSRGNQNQNAKSGSNANMTRTTTNASRTSANQRSGEAKTGELSKDNTTVLADKRINGLVVMTNKDLVPTLEQIIESMDIKLSQVLIETTIIEVQLGDGISTGMDWVQKGRQKSITSKQSVNEFGQKMFYVKDVNTGLLTGSTAPEGWTGSDDGKLTLSDVPVLSTITELSRQGLMNNTVDGAFALAGGANGGNAAYAAYQAAMGAGAATNLLSKSFSFVFDSDKLNLAGILHATANDSHSKYIASPVIMTLDNKEAIINATQMHYLLKGFQSSGNSYSTIAVPDYEQKELGIQIKVTPKINPNGTVMLTVEETYNQLGAKETIQYSASNGSGGAGGLQEVLVPTTITREMSSDVLLENNQTVVFAGLTDKMTSKSETGVPFLKDIPWIGKWLFSSVEESETRTELLVFMTPYVLDDAAAAQAEALRRKKTMPDPRPWDDDGWSASPLADPVSKKEQVRRLKEEAKKQDEERSARLEIEKWKVERAKLLQKLTKEERDAWLKMHKDELDEEAQEELEEKMLDPESQEDLKKLAAQIRAQKLAAAEGELKAAEEATKAENEHARLEAAKAAHEETAK